ncbi:hypothetical protein [uncultured Dialister sp.]|uniref:hypothetical protein n=1 Tax=uncultured Dialister sp. TaxID=278064 RepID=UPI0025DBDCC2|nr:hypothetical protein [uncultured Dialister sp.]
MEADSFLSPGVFDIYSRKRTGPGNLLRNPGNQEYVIFTKQPLAMNLRFRST